MDLITYTNMIIHTKKLHKRAESDLCHFKVILGTLVSNSE